MSGIDGWTASGAAEVGHCLGGGVLPAWLPAWAHPWLAGSQGIGICGVEWLMLIEGVCVLVVLLTLLGKWRPR